MPSVFLGLFGVAKFLCEVLSKIARASAVKCLLLHCAAACLLDGESGAAVAPRIVGADQQPDGLNWGVGSKTGLRATTGRRLPMNALVSVARLRLRLASGVTRYKQSSSISCATPKYTEAAHPKER